MLSLGVAVSSPLSQDGLHRGLTLEARLAVETIVKLLGRLPEEAVSIAPDIQIFLAENA